MREETKTKTEHDRGGERVMKSERGEGQRKEMERERERETEAETEREREWERVSSQIMKIRRAVITIPQRRGERM